MSVNIDVQIAEQNASVELPSNPDADLSTDGASQMAQEITQSPNAAISLQNSIGIQSVSDAVTYYGDILNFSTIDVDGTSIVAESSSDTLQLTSGDGVELDVDGKEITITSTGGGGVPLGGTTGQYLMKASDADGDAAWDTLAIADVDGLQTALDDKAAGTHYHTSLGNASTNVLSVDTAAYSVKEGFNTQATGNYSHAEGRSVKAEGDYSHAEGFSQITGYGKASGTASHIEGFASLASGYASHAEGYNTEAAGDYSHAQGYLTIAKSEKQTAMGKYNVEDSNGTYALIIGNGTVNARSNALAVRWNGLVDQAGRTAYPLFVYNGKPTEANAPITPCFIYDTSDGGLYYYSG